MTKWANLVKQTISTITVYSIFGLQQSLNKVNEVVAVSLWQIYIEQVNLFLMVQQSLKIITSRAFSLTIINIYQDVINSSCISDNANNHLQTTNQYSLLVTYLFLKQVQFPLGFSD